MLAKGDAERNRENHERIYFNYGSFLRLPLCATMFLLAPNRPAAVAGDRVDKYPGLQ